MAPHKVTFNKASLVGDEIANVLKAFQEMHIAGDGSFTQRCHALLSRRFLVDFR